MHFLQVNNLCKREKGYLVVNSISFNQLQAQRIAIAGETGSGKSTLLKMIAAQVQPDAGEIFFREKRVLGPLEKLLPGHPGIAYLAQQSDLPHFLKVEQVLDYVNQLPEADAKKLYEICRISHLVRRKTDQLSGGEKQRIALARLLVTSPQLLLLDEPFSNLDLVHKNILKKVIRDIGEQLNITCMLVSHDPQDTLPWADEILVMKDGVVVQQDNPRTIYTQPVNEYVAGLFGKYNLVEEETLQLFTQNMSITQQGKRVFIRPEQICIVNNEAVKATIKTILYLGNSYELELVVNDQLLISWM
jgi:ABC-type Fe3+/spermidine/putrescine transport system ATPase subunit